MFHGTGLRPASNDVHRLGHLTGVRPIVTSHRRRNSISTTLFQEQEPHQVAPGAHRQRATLADDRALDRRYTYIELGSHRLTGGAPWCSTSSDTSAMDPIIRSQFEALIGGKLCLLACWRSRRKCVTRIDVALQ